MSPYMTAAEAACFLRFSNLKAFHSFLWRRRKAGKPVTTYRLNGRLRFSQVDLDAAMTMERPSKQAATRTRR